MMLVLTRSTVHVLLLQEMMCPPDPSEGHSQLVGVLV